MSRSGKIEADGKPAFIEFDTMAEEYWCVEQWPKHSAKFVLRSMTCPCFTNPLWVKAE